MQMSCNENNITVALFDRRIQRWIVKGKPTHVRFAHELLHDQVSGRLAFDGDVLLLLQRLRLYLVHELLLELLLLFGLLGFA